VRLLAQLIVDEGLDATQTSCNLLFCCEPHTQLPIPFGVGRFRPSALGAVAAYGDIEHLAQYRNGRFAFLERISANVSLDLSRRRMRRFQGSPARAAAGDFLPQARQFLALGRRQPGAAVAAIRTGSSDPRTKRGFSQIEIASHCAERSCLSRALA
jgi:hypothetical protein